jgi:hypothetical protein
MSRVDVLSFLRGEQSGRAPQVIGTIHAREGDETRVAIRSWGTQCCELVVQTAEILEVEALGGGVAAIYLRDSSATPTCNCARPRPRVRCYC